MNIMLVTVSERTREIGIRKAIGGSRRSIILQFLIEASVICAMGGIIGLALGYVGTLIAGKLILNMMLLPGVPLSFGAVGFSVILGMIFGLYPAIKASGLQPVEALRAD
jgi:putative ABC transport system permease protein